MSECCHTPSAQNNGAHQHHQKRFDFLLWGSVFILTIACIFWFFFPQALALSPQLHIFAHSVVEFLDRVWWGLALGILFAGVLDMIPQEFITALFGRQGTFSGILRATGAGVLLDLCSHGILLVGMKLYQRGVSLGQVMAFLIASPWNSFSLTLILWALVGLKWTLIFILLSMVIAIASGMIFEKLVDKKILPANPNTLQIPEGFRFFPAAREHWRKIKWNPKLLGAVLWKGIKGSEMVLRWVFFGLVVAALVRAFVPPESFTHIFGPTIFGLAMTTLLATILEVCSEGSTPIATEFITRAAAPGNAFAFLMAGIATDYTEIMALKETTKSWKIALFLPLVTVPQVLILAYVLNQFGM